MPQLIQNVVGAVFILLLTCAASLAQTADFRSLDHGWSVFHDRNNKMCIIGHTYNSTQEIHFLFSDEGIDFGLTGLPFRNDQQYTVPLIFKDGKQIKMTGTGMKDGGILFLDIPASTQNLFVSSERLIIPDVGEFDLTGILKAMTAGMNCFSENY